MRDARTSRGCATGMSQQQVGDALGISQPAVSQQLRYAPDLEAVRPEELLDAAAPVLKALAAEYGYRRPTVFGSIARAEARQDSDIDLLVDVPPGTSSFQTADRAGPRSGDRPDLIRRSEAEVG